MNTLRILYHLAVADFFERTRRYSFLLVLAVVIYLGVLVNNGTLFMALSPGDLNVQNPGFRGEFNSAWIGTMTVLVTNLFLGLFAFYLVSNCIQRDVHTGVGQIIATCPVSRPVYLFGKWISNFMVLLLLELILAAAAAIMVLMKREAGLDLEALLMPFLAVGLPYMALIAALAVVFETIPWLRGAVGNVLYFFLWLAMLAGPAMLMLAGMELPLLDDPAGMEFFAPSLHAAAQAAYPNDKIGPLSIGNLALQLKVFTWHGLTWTANAILKQWFWAVFGLGLILVASSWFSRFDPSREGQKAFRQKSRHEFAGEPPVPYELAQRIRLPSLSLFVSKLAQVNPFMGVLCAELRLLFNGRRWWWWVITLLLNLSLFSNLPAFIKPFLHPLIWLWPLAVWSGMGNRERKMNTHQIVFSSARPVLRQLPAAWLAGILATGLLVIGELVFSLSSGNLPSLAAWAGAVTFIPSLALVLGVFSSGSRIFEVVYVIWWYLGPLQKSAGLDFTTESPHIFLLVSAGLILLAALWRGRQVRT